MSPETKIELVHITNLDGWSSQNISIMPPGACKDTRTKGKPCGIRAAPLENKITSTELNACDYGFLGITVLHAFKLLIVHYNVDVPRMPTIEVEIVKVLIKFFKPEFDDKGISDRLDKRKCVSGPLCLETCSERTFKDYVTMTFVQISDKR